ncbi:MAG: hypothetical protein QXJ28_00245 [Candidatus Pacearchaeota archaeon]
MKVQPYLKKLNNSKEFKEFIKKNPEAYLIAGFFVFDFENDTRIHQIDYYVPDKHSMVTFFLDNKIELKEAKAANDIKPQKIEGEIKLDLDLLKGIVQDEMKNHTVTSKLQKIIAVLQNIDGTLIWNLNCITNDMGIIKMHIDDKSHSVLKFEKVSLFDIIKKL